MLLETRTPLMRKLNAPLTETSLRDAPKLHKNRVISTTKIVTWIKNILILTSYKI